MAGAKTRFISLSTNPIKAEGAIYFSKTPYIQEILLSQCETGDLGAQAVLKNDRLKSVDLSNNNLTDVGVDGISGRSLMDLSLSQNKITSKGAGSIAKLASLKVLNLGANQLGDDGVLPLLQNKGIESLDLTQNGITGNGFSVICKSTTLKRVELYNNHIHFDTNAPLPANTSLEVVGLGHNELDGNCTQVLQSLASIPTLEMLNLTQNEIDDKGVKILYQYKSKSLRKIDLSNNPIQDKTLVKQGLDLS